jgi:UDP-GlcNAc:undecaprenyl-phosphate/decaprenyl-phosphate GlcNAc-1-phosphate transferase
MNASHALVAFAITLVLSPVVLFGLKRAGVLDVPSARSSHDRPIPRAGGIAPAIGALVGLAVASNMGGASRVALVIAASGLGVVGLAEDLFGISPILRLALQACVGVAALPWLLEGLIGPTPWQVVFAGGAVVWLVAYTNAFNFMDGIDGISVAQALVAGVAWYAIGRGEHFTALAVGAAVVSGAALGFAPFNILRPRMFLGDVGSYFLGGWIAALVVVALRAGLAPEAVLGPLTVYVADTGWTLVRRIHAGQAWYLPHRDHAYQQLVLAGWSHFRATLFVTVAMAGCSALGSVSLGGSALPRIAADVGIVAALAIYLEAPTRILYRTLPATDAPG